MRLSDLDLTQKLGDTAYETRLVELQARFQAIQQAMTGTVAMPTYAVVSPGGEVVGVWSGMASPGDFAAFLRSALDRTPQSA